MPRCLRSRGDDGPDKTACENVCNLVAAFLGGHGFGIACGVRRHLDGPHEQRARIASPLWVPYAVDFRDAQRVHLQRAFRTRLLALSRRNLPGCSRYTGDNPAIT